jgi:DNA-binding transcriptional LysR family regulator
MAKNVNTSLLRAFMAVAETSGMTSAANVLSLTQAAVSQQIKRLEDSFGCQLFERDRRGMKLTEAGERLFGQAKRLLALNDEIWAEMTSPLYEGEVRLGVPHDLVNAYLPPVLKSFAKAYPKVKIALVCRPSLDLLSALGTGQVDLTLVEERVPGADAEVLAVERLIWVGAKGGEAHLKRYVEDDNLTVLRFSGEGRPERYGEIAREVVRVRPDAIFAVGARLVKSLQAESNKIPIVGLVYDPKLASSKPRGRGAPRGIRRCALSEAASLSSRRFHIASLLERKLDRLQMQRGRIGRYRDTSRGELGAGGPAWSLDGAYRPDYD